MSMSASGDTLVIEHPLAIACDKVDFQVYPAAWFQVAQGGHGDSVRDEIDREIRAS